jgi:hypothetical protein
MSSPSSISSSIYPTTIVTVTVFSPSATSQVQQINGNSGPTIPIASIVGGCLAGVVLAVAAVVGWRIWGRNIKRKEEGKRKEAVRSPSNLFILIPGPSYSPRRQVTHRATQRNTRLNTFPSFPSSYTPSFGKHTQDRRVKFAVQTSGDQSDRVGRLPVPYQASFPARPSPLSQSTVK